MSFNYSGPYRATALWNEAVILFRDNIPLHEHRHRLHKHRNSFSGRGAVTFLHDALRVNALFNPDVTREQACHLLKHFLKADLIAPVQNCSTGNSKRGFYDSHKYLYEFTEKLLNFQRLTPLTTKVNDSNAENISPNDALKENFLNINTEKSWKKSVIKRIIELLRPCDVSELLNMNEINPKWVATNANPEWNKIKWNTELPHWILNTMQQLLQCNSTQDSSKDLSGSVYPSFQTDAFNVICNYFKTLENSIILECFYKIYVEVFNYLDYLNDVGKTHNEMKISSSQEDLLFKISSPLKQKIKKDILLPNNNLPPNHCYEAAFISDAPTFRVVPQSSVDSIHLQRGNKSVSQIYNDILTGPSFPHMQSRKNFVDKKNKNNTLEPKRTHLRPLTNVNLPYRSKSVFIDVKSGIVNEGFSAFSPVKLKHSENNFEPIKSKSHDCLDSKSLSFAPDEFKKNKLKSPHYGYINHGLSFSFENMNLLDDDHLDYTYALESLEKLLKVSGYNISTSDDDYSFHTALSSSEADYSESEFSKASSVTPYETLWNDHISQLGVNVFQLLLMLLPPCNRAQLKNLSVLVNEVSQNSDFPDLSYENMLQELSWSILRPCKKETSNSSGIVQRILFFIFKNHMKIFSDLPSELLSVITNEIYEYQLQVFTFCKQINGTQFEKQGLEESNIALNKLLEHIVNNKAISEKERKKHLKLFKESYPTIYKERFPSESTTSKSKAIFSLKNFRL